MDLRVAIVVPSNGGWESLTGWCIAEAVNEFNNIEYDGGEKAVKVFSVTGSMLPEVRQRCVSEAWKWEATHILWIDADMYFPHDVIRQLLSHNKSIVGANYVRRKVPTIPTAYVEDDDYIGPLYTKENDTGLVEVKHMGLGCVLTHISVYDAIELPYFNFEPIPPHNVQFRGEDVWFFDRCRDAGITTYVDQDLSKLVEHVGELRYTHGMAESSRDIRIDMMRDKDA